VRSLRTCARIRSLTTGTFNQVVKDRISIPPERREFSPVRNSCRRACARPDSRGGRPYMCVPTVPETLQTYRGCKTTVNARVPQNFHGISTTGKSERRIRDVPQNMSFRAAWAARNLLLRSQETSLCAQRYGLPPIRSKTKPRRLFRPSLFRPNEGGRQKIKKRTFWRSLL
jgi:hypothetical protein